MRPGVHGNTHVGLRKRRCVVRAVARHGNQVTVELLLADAFQFLFRRRLRHEIVDACFGRNRRGGQRIVTGDHHGFDSHFAQLREAFFDSAFDHVLEFNRAERQHVRGDDERRAAAM